MGSESQGNTGSEERGEVCSQVKREIWREITILGVSVAVSIQVPKCQGKFTIWVRQLYCPPPILTVRYPPPPVKPKQEPLG